MEMHASNECELNMEAKVDCHFCSNKFTKKEYVDRHVRECNDLVNMLRNHEADKERLKQM